LLDPTGNGETPIVKFNYRCTGEGVCFIEKNGLTSRAPSLSEEWQAVKAVRGKKRYWLI